MVPTPRRSSFHFLLSGLLAAALALLALRPALAQTLTLSRALSVQADTPRFSEDGDAEVVDLPDDWSESRPRQSGPVWYRFVFDAPGANASATLLGLYAERACADATVYLNGQLLHAGHNPAAAAASQCREPLLVALPNALLREGGNFIDLKLHGPTLQQVASRQRAGGLSALELGPYAAMAERQSWARALNVGVPQMASAALALLGSMMLVLGGLNRRERPLVHFGAMSLGWSLVTARLWWTHPPLSTYQAELLLATLMALVALAAVQFLMRYADWRMRRIDLGLWAQCALVLLSLLLGGPDNVHGLANAWYGVMLVEGLATLAAYLWLTRQRHTPAATVAIGTLALAIAGLEVGAHQSQIGGMWAMLSHVAVPLLFMAGGLRLTMKYGRALQEAEDSRLSLESRVDDATAQIERNFAQLAELRVEQVTERERKRIAADLHDDLGAKLLTIVHTSESERISTLAREALEEMRLSVRGLTGKPVRLIDALGDWRAEVVARLAQAGVEGEWNSPTDDVPQTLTARTYVQTTRILREAVSNIIKHSGASQCSVRCLIAEGDFQFRIQDNGKGIPLELDGRLDRGHGMSSMKHRAKQLHGQCLVESGPGYGTVIRLTLPLEGHGAKA